MKIKKFNEFINENYGLNNISISNNEYGYKMFTEISESFLKEINNGINEGNIVITNEEMLEEGFFDKISKLFGKGADATAEKSKELEDESERLRKYNFARAMKISGSEIEKIGKTIKKNNFEKEILDIVEELLENGESICSELAEKEEEMYTTTTKKLKEINNAIKDFTNESIKKIKAIAEKSQNKIADIMGACGLFCARMGEIAKKYMKNIGKGIVIGMCLPIVLTYSLYKGARTICKEISKKSNEVWNAAKEGFNSLKESITNWIVGIIESAKEELKKANDAIKDAKNKTYTFVGKTYLTIAATIGQIISDIKDSINQAYTEFIESAKEFNDDVKQYISDKWNSILKWSKNKITAFKEGVQTIWGKIKEKVNKSIDSINNNAQILKDEAKSTFEDFKEWNTSKQKRYMKSLINWSTEKWGEDWFKE